MEERENEEKEKKVCPYWNLDFVLLAIETMSGINPYLVSRAMVA